MHLPQEATVAANYAIRCVCAPKWFWILLVCVEYMKQLHMKIQSKYTRNDFKAAVENYFLLINDVHEYGFHCIGVNCLNRNGMVFLEHLNTYSNGIDISCEACVGFQNANHTGEHQVFVAWICSLVPRRSANWNYNNVVPIQPVYHHFQFRMRYSNA